MDVITIATTSDFDNEIEEAGGKLVIVNFCADWCEQCITTAPMFDGLSRANSDDVVYLKVDVGENSELATRYGITKIPHFILFKNGSNIHEIECENKATLMEKINEHK